MCIRDSKLEQAHARARSAFPLSWLLFSDRCILPLSLPIGATGLASPSCPATCSRLACAACPGCPGAPAFVLA
eukprot:86147-Pyramimonas_sp.AAC.1